MSDTVKAIIDETESISSALRKIEGLLLLLSEDEEYTSRKDLAELAYSVHAVKSQASELFALTEEGIAPALGRETFTLGNGAQVEARMGAPRKKWDHQGLAKKVSKKVVDSSFDIETGEMFRSHEEMVREILKYAAPSYWRVGALREIGVDADDYCEAGEPKMSLVIRRA